MNLFQVTCSAKNHVWAIDTKDKIWYRKGASKEAPLGNNWKSVSGSLKQVHKCKLIILKIYTIFSRF